MPARFRDGEKKSAWKLAALYKEILAKPFEFTKDETINVNPDEYDFPRTEAERKEAWRKRLKYMVLERYSDLAGNKGKK